MKQIYVHGLGQTAASWEAALCRLEKPDERICPDLAEMIPAGEAVTYQALYKAFTELCDRLEGPLAVSYTHLDVYKRQDKRCSRPGSAFWMGCVLS